MLKFLPKLRSLPSRIAGFTMIELLIVITILGILAVAVLSAINPIKQINRGRDTGLQSDAEQLLSATDRYNAFQQYYPWQNGESDVVVGIPLTRLDIDVPTNGGSPDCPISDLLSTDNPADAIDCTGSQELKASFINRVTDTEARGLFIYNRGNAGDSTYVCFVPQSGAFQTKASDRCSGVTGSLPTDLEPIRAQICDETGGRPTGTAMAAYAGIGEAYCLP